MRFLIKVAGDNLTQGERFREFEAKSLSEAITAFENYPKGSELWVNTKEDIQRPTRPRR
jgi:hypothetical protein